MKRSLDRESFNGRCKCGAYFCWGVKSTNKTAALGALLERLDAAIPAPIAAHGRSDLQPRRSQRNSFPKPAAKCVSISSEFDPEILTDFATPILFLAVMGKSGSCG
jgi:hypothetical protein